MIKQIFEFVNKSCWIILYRQENQIKQRDFLNEKARYKIKKTW